ncbi:iron ABC transporter permease [Rhodovibrio salinarum]|uniref:Iron ABC transporter permease n=1 Tax=Rhodovibrio salinarum TaxID=1087 RepID=A0A934QJN7_9PROT|nr:iron ABC transporter permease [Rhodovibrio salinarum]MBK1698137.1 iron ABC transporter permease [Rhodovibrio salinarum]
MTAEAPLAGGVPRWVVGYLLPALGIVALVLLSFAIGKFPVAPGELVQVVAAKLFGGAHGLPDTYEAVVWRIRLPRIATACLVGAGLAAAGATYQGLFRNPLVSPDILGVSSGAGFGAALAILMSLPVVAVQGMAFVFGLVAVAVVYAIAQLAGGRHEPLLVLVLAGVVVGALFSAAISLIKYVADPYDQLPAIEFWLLGGLSGVRLMDILPVLLPVLIGLVPLVLLRWRLNVLSLEDEEARALGLRTGPLRALAIACATLMTAAAVSIAGMVGWVGLIVPHIARMLVGPSFVRLLPAAMLIGAAYLLAVDNIARTAAVIEIPLGVLNAFLGAPFFLFVLARARRSWQ